MRLSPSDSRRGITATCPALFLVAGAALAAVLLGARGAAAAACALQQPNISRTDFAVAYRASKVWEAAPRGRAPAAAYRQVCLALSADTPPAGGCGGAGFAPTDCCVQGDPKFGMATLALKPADTAVADAAGRRLLSKAWCSLDATATVKSAKQVTSILRRVTPAGYRLEARFRSPARARVDLCVNVPCVSAGNCKAAQELFGPALEFVITTTRFKTTRAGRFGVCCVSGAAPLEEPRNNSDFVLPPPLPLPTADELPQEVRDMLASGEPAFSALADAAVSVEGMTVSDAAGKLAAAAAGMTIDEPPPEPPETPPGRRLLEIPDGRTLAALLVAASPSEHSSRALGLVSPAKDQGKTCNSCGAFAAIAVLESAVMAARARLGLGGAQAAPDYSEAHYFYCQMGQFCGCAGLKIQQWGQALVGYANSDLRDERCMPYTDAVTTAAGSLGACVQASLAPCPGGVPVVGAGFGAVSVEPVPAAGGAAWPLGSQALAQAQFRAQVQAQVRASGAALTAMMLYPSFGDYYTLDLAANKLAVYTRPAGDARAAMGIHAMAVVGYSHARKEWLIKNSWGRLRDDDGFFRLAYEANTDFLFPGLYGALYSFPQPAVQQTLAFGQCVTYTTMPGDDAGTVAYVWHKGASPLSVLFDNGAALEANGWTMGKALPVGLPLDVCNNLCLTSNDCKAAAGANSRSGYCLKMLRPAQGAIGGTCMPAGVECRTVTAPGGLKLLKQPCATAGAVLGGSLPAGTRFALWTHAAKAHVRSTCPGPGDDACYAYAQAWEGAQGWVSTGTLRLDGGGACGVTLMDTKHVSCCGGGEACSDHGLCTPGSPGYKAPLTARFEEHNSDMQVRQPPLLCSLYWGEPLGDGRTVSDSALRDLSVSAALLVNMDCLQANDDGCRLCPDYACMRSVASGVSALFVGPVWKGDGVAFRPLSIELAGAPSNKTFSVHGLSVMPAWTPNVTIEFRAFGGDGSDASLAASFSITASVLDAGPTRVELCTRREGFSRIRRLTVGPSVPIGRPVVGGCFDNMLTQFNTLVFDDIQLSVDDA